MTKHFWALGGLLLLLAGGCGGDPCADASEALCAKACECGGGECVFGDGMGSVTFESRSDCEIFYSYACSQGGSEADIDWDQCLADTEGGVCANNAFAIPASCEAP